MRLAKCMWTLRVAIVGTFRSWMWLGLGILLITVAGTGAGDGPHADCPPVDVPVILDGVRYESAEFNDLQSELCGEVDLIYTVNPQNGDLHAFTTKERFNEWAAKKGLPALDDGATEGGMGPILTRDGDTIVCAATDSPEDCESRLDTVGG